MTILLGLWGVIKNPMAWIAIGLALVIGSGIGAYHQKKVDDVATLKAQLKASQMALSISVKLMDAKQAIEEQATAALQTLKDQTDAAEAEAVVAAAKPDRQCKPYSADHLERLRKLIAADPARAGNPRAKRRK